MAEEKVSNKLITTILAFIIIIAAIVILFVNLPEDDNDKQIDDETGDEEQEEEEEEEQEEEEENGEEGPNYIFNLSFGEENINYSLEDLEALESFSCTATMIKDGFLPEDVATEGPFEFTGIRISTLVNEFDNIPEKYNLSAKSSDGPITIYNMSDIQGNIKLYNESGIVVNNTGATMILAYKKDGVYLGDDEGPLRIVYCHDEYYTLSIYWPKFVIWMDIIEL
jgi:hypothetical protein